MHYGKALVEANRRPGRIPVYGSNGQTGWHDAPLAIGPAVILGRKGMGPLGVEWCSTPFWVIDTAYYVTFKKEHIFPRFFYYFTKYTGLNHLKHGTSNPSLSRDVFYRQSIPCPPLSVQGRIAEVLSAYDDLIENNTRRIAILEEMARRIFEEWFVRFRAPGVDPSRLVDSPLGPIPEGWEVTTIDALAAYVNRGIAPKYDDNGETLVINQKCIRDQRLSLAPARQQSKSVPEAKFVKRHDILINSTGVGTLGRVAQAPDVPPGCTVDSHVTIVRRSECIDPYFWGLALLRMEPALSDAGIGSTGQTELQRDRIKAAQLVAPPAELQMRFGRFVEPMRELPILLERQNQNLRSQRDLLLPKLISGEIDVSAAEQIIQDAAA